MIAIRDVGRAVVVVTVRTSSEMGVTVEAVARPAVLSTERTDRIPVLGTRVAVCTADSFPTVSTGRGTLGTFGDTTVFAVSECLTVRAAQAYAAAGTFTPTPRADDMAVVTYDWRVTRLEFATAICAGELIEYVCRWRVSDRRLSDAVVVSHCER